MGSRLLRRSGVNHQPERIVQLPRRSVKQSFRSALALFSKARSMRIGSSVRLKGGGRDFGGREGIRTLDLSVANAALSQLSYAPMAETDYRRASYENPVPNLALPY